MKILNNIMPFTPLLAAVTLAVCSGVSLSGYVPPVFEPIEVVAEEETEEKEEKVQGNFDLEDGIYEGTGTGFAGKIKVAVEIKDKSIVSIEIIDSGADDAAFVNRAKGVIEKIIAAQSFDVDVISGATYSSNGIISAVKNALTGEVDNNKTGSVPTGQGSTSVSTVEEPSAYKDGTYYGSGVGFGGTTTVKVVISGGKITSITIQSTNDDSSYMQSASSIISKMIAGQTTNVDTVSGATYSSVGIIQAVRNALSQAAINSTVDTNTGNVEKEEEVTIIEGLFPYVNGTYYGIGEGYNGQIKVALKIEGKTIRSISIVEHEDDAAFMVRAEKILDKVVNNQTTKVDVISGATFSSEGILEAIQNALKEADKATNGNEEKPDDSEVNNPGGSVDNSGENNSSGEYVPVLYNNGKYTATVECLPDEDEDFEPYTLSVTITVKDDKIVAVTDVIGYGDDGNDKYINWAANGRSTYVGVITQILESGTANSDEIDTVSKATCTSVSIIEACQNALELAKIKDVEDVEKPEDTEEPKDTEEPEDTEEPDDKDGSEECDDQEEDKTTIYKNGEYAVSVLCSPDEDEDFDSYNLSMVVTVKNDKIVSITNVTGDGDEGNDKYINWAVNGRSTYVGVVTQILNLGYVDSGEVNVVSKATCTSNSIIEACQLVLTKAKIQ